MSSPKQAGYVAVANPEPGNCSCHKPPAQAQAQAQHGGANLVLICLLVSTISAITASMSTARFYACPEQSCHDPSQQLFSPVNGLVEYITYKFNRGRGRDKTPFQGMPTEENDRLWSELYSPGILSSVDAEVAGRLPEETERLPVPGRENEYVITLDVFHQLHCLDVVRMALYRDRYDKHFYFPNGTIDYCKWLHVDHCLDQVRQALVCSADTSVVYYAWSDVVQGLRPRVDNMHTCRNYTKILEWASRTGVEASLWRPSHHVVQAENGELKIERGRNHALEGEGECNAV